MTVGKDRKRITVSITDEAYDVLCQRAESPRRKGDYLSRLILDDCEHCDRTVSLLEEFIEELRCSSVEK